MQCINSTIQYGSTRTCKMTSQNKNYIKLSKITLIIDQISVVYKNKAYRPNAHLLYIVMHYNGNII